MKRETLIIIGVALVAIVIGVAVFIFDDNNLSNTSSAVANNQPSSVAVPFTPFASGTQSKVTNRVNYVITSETQLSELWKMVDATGTPPAVDFNKDAVIAVFAGQQPTGGYAIQVSKIIDSTSRLVSVTIQRPDSKCMVTQSFTAPYELVTIPATTLPLAHEDIPVTKSCSN